MSQSYFPGEGASSAGESSSKQQEESTRENDPQSTMSNRPEYMTVGGGGESTYASQLMAELDRDSGYGTSIAGDSQFNGGDMRAWRDQMMEDRPTPAAHTPGNQPPSEHDRRLLASHVHQLYYNQNRVALAKAINRTVDTLKELQRMNAQWPAHYPTVQGSVHESRPSLHAAQTTRDAEDIHPASRPQSPDVPRPFPPRRAGTSLGEHSTGESSGAVQKRKGPEPRLLTPQIAQEFSILKLDLKLGALSQAELVHSLEKSSIASLLDGKIASSIRHLLSLRDRIEDTSSKVLVTGDLNAGKSTFCNALLRRKVLPVDQQPCTSIFCEILDARENGGLEEAHAVHKDVIYNRNDESTYDVFKLEDLEKVVVDNDHYNQCKIYVKDSRTIDKSLLNNGVVDITLIDAPGLNNDSVKTTAVFARQEEIDVVVFVVSAANHFTQSAKEFIWQAAHEKAYMFMVINGFDNIRDKERCQKMILEQIKKYSPHTFKDAAELVHFVSSNAVPAAPALPVPAGGGGGGGSGGSSGPPDDGPDNDDDDGLIPAGKHGEPGSPPGKGKGKEKEKEKIQDFENLEGALRRFILEKRARSKLAPAKTYLVNVLNDLNALANVNRDVASSELERVSKELSEIVPEFEERKKERFAVSDQVNRDNDEIVTDVYNHTRSTLSTTIDAVGKADLGIQYPGLWSVFDYAEDLKAAMLDTISEAVRACESYGRSKSIEGVNSINSLGLLHVGDKFETLNFKSDLMFTKRKHARLRAVDTEVEVWDFFDLAGLWERQEKVVGSGMALTVVGTLGGRALGGVGWIDGAFGAVKIMGSRNLRSMILPSIALGGKSTSPFVPYPPNLNQPLRNLLTNQFPLFSSPPNIRLSPFPNSPLSPSPPRSQTLRHPLHPRLHPPKRRSHLLRSPFRSPRALSKTQRWPRAGRRGVGKEKRRSSESPPRKFDRAEVFLESGQGKWRGEEDGRRC